MALLQGFYQLRSKIRKPGSLSVAIAAWMARSGILFQKSGFMQSMWPPMGPFGPADRQAERLDSLQNEDRIDRFRIQLLSFMDIVPEVMDRNQLEFLRLCQ